MRLLLVTQVVDQDHVIMAFFVRWIAQFAQHCDQVHVVCLQAGRHNLPENVHVHTLGKESGASRLTYLWRFFKLIWQLRHQYDGVFVHMNQVYVLLGAPLWRLLGKRVGLWYTHGTVSGSLRLATRLTHTVFTASADSFGIVSDKVQVTGHGIDTTRFCPDPTVTKNIDLVTIGRITPSKNLTTLVDVLADLSDTVTLSIGGAPVTPDEQAYQTQLQQHIADRGLTKRVHLLGRVSQTDLPHVLQRSRVFVTAAQNGSLDKAMLEAAACGTHVVSMAPGSASLPLGENQVSTTARFIDRIAAVVPSTDIATDLVVHVQREHSLAALIPRIIATLQT